MINAIDNVVNSISGVLYQPYVVPLLLMLAGIYFTIRTRLLQFRLFGESIRVVKEKPVNLGATSSFGALMVSTASRVGTGNIMGVSTALCLGGPGARHLLDVDHGHPRRGLCLCGVDPGADL